MSSRDNDFDSSSSSSAGSDKENNEQTAVEVDSASQTQEEQTGTNEDADQMQFLSGTAPEYQQAASLYYTPSGLAVAGRLYLDDPLHNPPTVRGDEVVTTNPALLYGGERAAPPPPAPPAAPAPAPPIPVPQQAIPIIDQGAQSGPAAPQQAVVSDIAENASGTGIGEDNESEGGNIQPYWHKGQGKVPEDVWKLRNAIRKVKKNPFGYPVRNRFKSEAALKDHFSHSVGHLKPDSPLAAYSGDLRFWDKRFWLYLKTDHNGENLVNIPNETLDEEHERWEDYEEEVQSEPEPEK